MRLRFVGVLLCFLVLAFVHHCLWVVGVGAFWVGHKVFVASRHTVGFTFNTVLASTAVLVVVARAAGLGFPWVWVVCGGLFVICIVVASIFVLYCFLCFV